MYDLFRRFLRMESAGGILLIVASVLAMLMANSPLSSLYQGFINTPVEFQFGALELRKPLLLWINDGLMAVFFLLIGLEVKREVLDGALSSRDQAMLPAIAAVGGMAVPALVYLLFNGGDALAAQGWAIPAATDIAFALGVLALLGKRVPLALKIFLLALAIIDDLGVIVIIALFYSGDLYWGSLVVASIACAGLLFLNKRGEARLWPYLLLGLIMWVGVLKSGVHATLAGVITGFAIPLNTKDGQSPLKRLEHMLHPYSSFGILPLFAFANAGVSVAGMTFGGLFAPLPMGVMLGLLIGKPLGIFGFSWLSVKAGLTKLPNQATWLSLFGVSVLCGIGFTMSMFITTLAWQHTGAQFDDWARLGILSGSIMAAVLGYIVLNMTLPKTERRSAVTADVNSNTPDNA